MRMQILVIGLVLVPLRELRAEEVAGGLSKLHRGGYAAAAEFEMLTRR